MVSTFSTFERSKVVLPCGVLYILTWKRDSRHNGVHFFNLSTSKSALNVCFVHFDLEMCFAPQRRALFRHLNFQKWSEREVFLFFLLNYKCASRHNGVQFFISHLASWLSTHRFSEPTPEPQTIGKTQWIATSSFFSDLLTSFLLLSDSSHLCFSNCPTVRIVGSFTSKFPSMICCEHPAPKLNGLSNLFARWRLHAFFADPSQATVFGSLEASRIVYWLVVWLPFFIFPYIGNFIIPIDFHIFQRGGPTTNQYINAPCLSKSGVLQAIGFCCPESFCNDFLLSLYLQSASENRILPNPLSIIMFHQNRNKLGAWAGPYFVTFS